MLRESNCVVQIQEPCGNTWLLHLCLLLGFVFLFHVSVHRHKKAKMAALSSKTAAITVIRRSKSACISWVLSTLCRVLVLGPIRLVGALREIDAKPLKGLG